MQVFDNRLARQKKAHSDAERVANEKVAFADERTLQSWLKQIVQLNEIEIVSRVNQSHSKQLELKDDYLQKAEQMANRVRAQLVELNYKPSHFQFASAITSVMLFARHNRLLLTIPPGKGMSRVVCAIVTLFEKVRKGVNLIFIIFSSDILHETYKQVYASSNQLLDIEIKLAIGIKNVAEQIGPEDLLILDDADYYLFDDVCFRNATLQKMQRHHRADSHLLPSARWC